MYDCNMGSWTPTCKVVGAPKGIDSLQCISEEDGCTAFRQGDCRFSGSFTPYTVDDLQQCEVSSDQGLWKAVIFSGQGVGLIG